MAREKTDPAIVSVQWLLPEEMNELDQALILAQAETIQPGRGRAGSVIVPDVVSVTFDEPQPETFLRKVEETLRDRENVQIVYVSAHGLNGRVQLGSEGLASLSYGDLGGALSRGLNATSSVVAVFGMCEAGGPDEQALLGSLPDAIDEVYAFTGKPLARDVAALLAGIVIDEMRLFESLHRENETIFGGGVPSKRLPAAGATFEHAIDRVLKGHAPEPEYFVGTGAGRFVRHFHRDEVTRVWVLSEVVAVPGRIADQPSTSSI